MMNNLQQKKEDDALVDLDEL